MKGQIISIHISKTRGTIKTNVSSCQIIANWGLEGDAHAGRGEKQISIFPLEALKKVPESKRKQCATEDYTENITISGIPLEKLKVGCILKIGKVQIKICSIGKEPLREEGRSYIVSREGRFGIALQGGTIEVNNTIEVEETT